MPHWRNLRIVLLAIIAIVCSGFGACDALTRVEGAVVDDAGNPLAGAAVRLTRVSTGRTSQMSTGEDGKFSVEQIHGPFAGRFDLVVSKPGYEDFHRVVQTDAHHSLRIVMTKAAPATAPTMQNILEQMFPGAPKKAENADCFRRFTSDSSVRSVVEKCGRPDEETGSGLYIFVWKLQDGSTVAIGTGNLDRIYDITYTPRSGKSLSLLQQKK